MSSETLTKPNISLADDCPPDRVLDGEFKYYGTQPSFRREPSVLELLRTLASIFSPFMKRDGLVLLALVESFPTSPLLLGQNTSCHGIEFLNLSNQNWLIEIRLRPHDLCNKFLSLESLIQTLCHEIAHCRYPNHTVDFLREWKSIMEEVDEDLGSILDFRNITEGDPYKDIMDDLEKDAELRAEARSRACNGKRGIGCLKAMLAAKLW